MSVLAMAEITLSFERDIASVHRFYKISASSSTPADWTASQISKFISNGTIVSWWQTTEPAYDNSTTNSLYFFDLTIFSDDTYNKSNISKSSSYEAAKQAYEEALAAQYGTEALAAKVKNYWWDSTGAHIASGVIPSGSSEPNDVTEGTPSTYGFNSLVGLSSLTFGYNSYKTVELSGSTPSLKFYKPSKTAQGAQTASLDSKGLVLSEGGIEAGTKDSSDYIYVYSKDDATNHNISINNSGNKSNWRIIAGNKFGVDKAGNLYASNANISGTITVGSGSNVYTKTEADNAFDESGAASAAQTAAISAAASDATSKANAAQSAAISAAASDATSKANAAKEAAIEAASSDATIKANEVNDALELYKTATNSTLSSLQNQVDGQVEVWYYDVDPTTSNQPASSWNTTELKARHEGDLYYNIDNGHSWRWLKNGNTYGWQQIPDSDAAAALAKATNAETLAGNKRRIFTAQPTPPYDIGDLWVTGSQIKYCSSSKASGQSYSSSDWTLTATDDTKANSAVYEEQYVYISKASGTTSVGQNTTWVARSDDVQNTWTTKRPTYNTNYPVLFVAKQRKTVSQSSGTTCTCTTPVKDDTTTVIDGGHITTGTIDAARLNVGDIISSGSIAVTSDIPTDLSDLNNDTGYITSSSVPTKVSELTNDSGFQSDQQVSNSISTATSDIKTYITNQGFAKSTDIPDTSGLASKSDSIYRTQRIYRRYTSSQTNLSGPTTWVTADTDIYNNWTTKIPPLISGSTKYPYLYTCTQKQTITQYNSGSTCTCSTVLLDDSTTVIDGGTITTGKIGANYIDVNTLIANNNIVVGNDISDFVTQQDIDDTIEETTVGDLYDGGSYTKTADLANTTAVQNAAKTASNYLGNTDNQSGVTLKAVNGTTTANTSTSNYIKINENGLSVFKGGVSVAQYGDTSTIGKNGSLRLNLLAGQINFLNDSSEAIFSINENSSNTTERNVEVIVFQALNEVDQTKRTILDELVTNGNVNVILQVEGDADYTLESSEYDIEIIQGTSISVTLTSEGVAKVTSLMTMTSEGDEDEEDSSDSGSSEETTIRSGTLSIEYQIQHFDKALLNMTGKIEVSGENIPIEAINTNWSSSNKTDTFISATLAPTGQSVKRISLGIGSSGNNRGIYDSVKKNWLIYADENNKTLITGSNFTVNSSGKITNTYSIITSYNGSVRHRVANTNKNKIIDLLAATDGSIGLYNPITGSYLIRNDKDNNTRIRGGAFTIPASGDATLTRNLALTNGGNLILNNSTGGVVGKKSSGSTTYAIGYVSSSNNVVIGDNDTNLILRGTNKGPYGDFILNSDGVFSPGGRIYMANNTAIQGRSKNGSTQYNLVSVDTDNYVNVGDTDATGIKIYKIWGNTTTTAANVHVDSAAIVQRYSSSSRRYKDNIENVSLNSLKPEHLYDIEIKQFKYNEKMNISESDPRYNKTLIGFIAEQVYEHYPIAVDINQDGSCETWNPNYIIPPMLALIQEQKKQIDELEKRVAELEK